MEYLILILNIMFFSISRHCLCSLYLEQFMEISVRKNERRRKINKFKESAWKSVYFLSGESLFLPVTYSEPWFTKYQILMDRTRRSGLARSENKVNLFFLGNFISNGI